MKNTQKSYLKTDSILPQVLFINDETPYKIGVKEIVMIIILVFLQEVGGNIIKGLRMALFQDDYYDKIFNNNLT